MKTIKDTTISPFYRNACVAMIWLVVIYASIIQNTIAEIPHAMLIIGLAILLFYILTNIGKPFDIRKELAEESVYMLLFMAYMLIFGTMISIDRGSHLSQVITSLQYLFVLIVISSLIKQTGTDTFHLLLLVQAIILAIFFLREPVEYIEGRYSISKDVNPNGLGMEFATGIWAVLYMQQKKKLPMFVAAILTVLLGYCIVQTGSRKSLIAAGLTIVLWLIFCFLPDAKTKGGYKSLFKFFAMGVLIATIGYLFIGLYADSTLASRMESLLHETQEGKRSDMYREGIEILKTNPLFGIGFQGFKHLYGKYSHATIVEVPVSGGVVGALLYFGIYVFSIKKAIQVYIRTKGTSVFFSENCRIKMALILWAVMLFYTTCIIHPYQFDSYVMFGVIFGETAHIERKLNTAIEENATKKKKWKYIKYE